MVYRLVTYVPGLYKIFDEILVNAADNKQRDPSMHSLKVVIDVEQNLISVCNTGDGVPVEIHQEEGVYVPEMIFGRLFDDHEKKTTGAKLTNIFSTQFTIETADGKRQKKYKQVFENNMGEETVKVELNGNKVPIKSFSDYVDLYLSAANKSRTCYLPRMTEKVNERWEVCVSLSEGQFQQISFVNSIATIKGGTHVDYATSQITKYIVGQFGTRNSGGEDATCAKYIFTKLSPATRVLFPKDDYVLLKYLNENGKKIEPTWYMPIIPTVLVNGCEGIGTGWSSFIPNYNLREIVANLRRLLNGESMVPMDPWYRGFKGTIEKTATKEAGSTYTITGVFLEEFFNLRLQYYELRKKVMLENLELELLKLENKVKFILGVVSEEIKVNNSYMKKADLVEELKQRGFVPFPKKSKPVEAAVAGAINGTEEAEESSDAPAPSSTFIPGSEYDYLLSLAIATLTLEKFNVLLADRDKMKEEVEDLKKATARSLWLKDLASLEVKLENLDLADAKAEEWTRLLRRPAPTKKPTEKGSESERIELSTNSAMDTDNNVVEVAKPKDRQGADKKAPQAAKRKHEDVDEDEMMDLAQYCSGSTRNFESIVDDDDEVVEAVVRKRGAWASRKLVEVVMIVSPEKKARKMRLSPFNKKSGLVMAANKEKESSIDIVEEKQRPQRANRKPMKYVLSDSESDSGNDSEFDDIEDDE
ncbi:hypothetical protein AALP_AA8G193400 [Arabis alpina]|uniref:DNA topoisomerase 2 n=1 Tax=Arabis alpina TaxID=50452 RepID=A0A087G820_ARAAL|nr:hypothetical protein AALP_AA8G193400 [Arabis alpina]